MTTVSTALLAAISIRCPGMTIANALGLVEDFERYGYRLNTEPDLLTHAGRVQFARTSHAVMGHLPDRKIQAIKELRTLTGCGLKEAKDALDEIQPVGGYRA